MSSELAVREETTDVRALVQSGRYRVASPSTLEMMRQLQSPGTNSGESTTPPGDALSMRSLRQYVVEQEGLNIGEQRRRALSQQWRFFLSCEPLQRGLDAGLIVGSFAAAVAAYRHPRLRSPFPLGFCFVGGFCAGLLFMPIFVVTMDSYNSRRITQRERELFARQRSELRAKN